MPLLAAFSVPPLKVSAPLLNAVLFPTLNVPYVNAVAPVYVSADDNVNVPVEPLVVLTDNVPILAPIAPVTLLAPVELIVKFWPLVAPLIVLA
jgi:hypothetical protein